MRNLDHKSLAHLSRSVYSAWKTRRPSSALSDSAFRDLFIYSKGSESICIHILMIKNVFLKKINFFLWFVIKLTHLLCCSPPNPLATPPAGLSQVWADRSRLLRFCHDTGNLTLTVRQNLRWSSEESRHADILLLRDRLRDEDFLREVSLDYKLCKHRIKTGKNTVNYDQRCK